MMTYLIDGNNLIGKIDSLNRIQKKDKQGTREKLAFLLDNYFRNIKNKVYLHFDGFKNDSINTSSIKIIYSDKKTADEMIKNQIEQSSGRKNIIVITSDFNLAEFAHVCSCTVMSSEQFAKQLNKKDDTNNEQKIIDSMSVEEFKKIFNAGR